MSDGGRIVLTEDDFNEPDGAATHVNPSATAPPSQPPHPPPPSTPPPPLGAPSQRWTFPAPTRSGVPRPALRTASRKRLFSWKIAVIVLLVGVGSAIGAIAIPTMGGNARSASSFCSTLATGNAQLRQSAEATNVLTDKNALAGLVAAFGGFGDFEKFLQRLNQRAPAQISDDMQTVTDDWKASMDDAGSAAGEALSGNYSGIAKVLVRQLVHARSYQRVDAFAQSNCGSQIFGTAPR